MFPNEVMMKQETWNNILAAMIAVRDAHGWREEAKPPKPAEKVAVVRKKVAKPAAKKAAKPKKRVKKPTKKAKVRAMKVTRKPVKKAQKPVMKKSARIKASRARKRGKRR
jgi:hypothetical protein